MTAIVKWNLCLDLASIPQFQIIFHFPDLIADPFLKTKSPDSNSQKKLPPNTSSFSDLTATPLAGWLGGAQEAKVFGARSKRSDIKTSKMLKSENQVLISPAGRESAGIYTCTAHNKLGVSGPREIQLDVECEFDNGQVPIFASLTFLSFFQTLPTSPAWSPVERFRLQWEGPPRSHAMPRYSIILSHVSQITCFVFYVAYHISHAMRRYSILSHAKILVQCSHVHMPCASILSHAAFYMLRRSHVSTNFTMFYTGEIFYTNGNPCRPTLRPAIDGCRDEVGWMEIFNSRLASRCWSG